MSETTVPENTAPENTDVSKKTTDGKVADIEWSYSGKAMRGQNILYSLITVVLLAAAIVVTLRWNQFYLAAWIGFVVLTVILWGQFCCVYFYRTWTIRYKLTNLRLYSYKGFFTKTQDTMELAFVEDVRVTQTLWDRIVNGGVGTINVYSGADKTNVRPEEGGNSILVISGVESPQEIFEEIDNRRTELRKSRSILQA